MIRKFKNYTNKGFTLIELVVVVAVISILSAVAVPQLKPYIDNSNTEVIKANLKTFHTAAEMVDKTVKGHEIKLGGSANKPFLKEAAKYANVREGKLIRDSEIDKYKAFKSEKGIYVEYHHKGEIYKYPDFSLNSQENPTTAGDFVAINNKVLGWIGVLKEENVTGLENQENDNIVINIPKGTNQSGQIMSKENMDYGVYDVSLRLPDNDGLLSGFFLYGGENEVDIEMLYRDGEWQVWTTIYNPSHPDYRALNRALRKKFETNGGEVFMAKMPLGFDPTKSSNTYTIDMKKNYISFEINGNEISRWDGTFNLSTNMKLYVGTFYTHWLNSAEYYSMPEEERDWMKANAYDAYEPDGVFQSRMNSIFGRDNLYSMDIDKINIKLDK